MRFAVQLLRRYDIAIAKPLEPMKITNSVIWFMDDFWVKLTRREGMVI